MTIPSFVFDHRQNESSDHSFYDPFQDFGFHRSSRNCFIHNTSAVCYLFIVTVSIITQFYAFLNLKFLFLRHFSMTQASSQLEGPGFDSTQRSFCVDSACSPCRRGFSPRTLASSHSRKTSSGDSRHTTQAQSFSPDAAVYPASVYE